MGVIIAKLGALLGGVGVVAGKIVDNPVGRIATAIVVSVIFFGIIFAMLPVISMPVELASALDWLFTSLWAFDFMIPVATLVACFTMVIYTDIILIGVKILLFIKKHVTQQH